MNNSNSVLLRLFTTLMFLFCVGNVFAQTQNLSEKKEASLKTEQNTTSNEPKANFQVSISAAPQGNSLEAQIARAKYYQAQYTHEPATQAKYQIEIDMLEKKRLEEGTKKD